MTVRRTVPRLKAFAYAVRSLWGFHVIYGETGHGNLEMDRSHDNKPFSFPSTSTTTPMPLKDRLFTCG